jgi:phytoene dehydrogenase-like protein
MNVTVIGSGLSRLTAAAYLAQVGHQVTVFEQYHRPGGVTAPSGSHAMTLYTICPDTLREGDWDERKEEYADKPVACAERHIPGLAEHTQVRGIATPKDFWARTHLDRHAFGGIAPVIGSRRVPHDTPLAGLWFVGAQSESGGRVNNVVPEAFRTAKRVAESTPPGA